MNVIEDQWNWSKLYMQQCWVEVENFFCILIALPQLKHCSINSVKGVGHIRWIDALNDMSM